METENDLPMKTVHENNSTESLIPFEVALKYFLGNWVWRAVHALVNHPNFNDSPLWISQKIGVSVEEAAEAVEGLLGLGLIKRVEGKMQAEKVRFIMPEKLQTIGAQADNHQLLAQQVLSRLNPDQFEVAFHDLFMATNTETFNKFYLKFIQLLDEFSNESEKLEKRDRIICLSMEAVNPIVYGSGGKKSDH